MKRNDYSLCARGSVETFNTLQPHNLAQEFTQTPKSSTIINPSSMKISQNPSSKFNSNSNSSKEIVNLSIGRVDIRIKNARQINLSEHDKGFKITFDES